MPEQQTLDMWAIVEVMGHKAYAGHVTEQTVGSDAFVRVDVPETEQLERTGWNGTVLVPARTTAAYSKLLGPKSIFAITPCTEEVARLAAVQLEASNNPIPVALPPARQLAATSSAGDEQAEFEIDEDAFFRT